MTWLHDSAAAGAKQQSTAAKGGTAFRRLTENAVLFRGWCGQTGEKREGEIGHDRFISACILVIFPHRCTQTGGCIERRGGGGTGVKVEPVLTRTFSGPPLLVFSLTYAHGCMVINASRFVAQSKMNGVDK